MLYGGVAACHTYGVCTVRCAECGMVCVLCGVLSATYDMLPHHRITYNYVVFFLPNFKLNITLARL